MLFCFRAALVARTFFFDMGKQLRYNTATGGDWYAVQVVEQKIRRGRTLFNYDRFRHLHII